MRARLLFTVLVISLAALPSAQAVTFNVSITKSGFSPSALTVAVGDTVVWTNADTSSHQLESKSAGFASPLLAPGQTFSFTYKAAGKYAYQDQVVKKNRGTVTVQAPATAISVTASAPSTLIVYGGTVTLSGSTSSKRAGETVAVYSQPFGASSLAPLGTTLTEAGGSWSFLVRPRLQTVYQARWKPAVTTASSSSITVRVRPQVLLRVKVASGRTVTFFTKARGVRSYAGAFVYLQRRNAFGQWVSLRKVTLTATSAVTFKARLPKGRSRVRVFMPKPQAGPGYLAGISRTLSLVR